MPLAVLEDLRAVRVLLGRDVADLLEQRQVDVRLDVALRARVAVPVPGAAEVAALPKEGAAAPTSFKQAGASRQAREPPTNTPVPPSFSLPPPPQEGKIRSGGGVGGLALQGTGLGVAARAVRFAPSVCFFRRAGLSKGAGFAESTPGGREPPGPVRVLVERGDRPPCAPVPATRLRPSDAQLPRPGAPPGRPRARCRSSWCPISAAPTAASTAARRWRWRSPPARR